jgi:hypothetical protein
MSSRQFNVVQGDALDNSRLPTEAREPGTPTEPSFAGDSPAPPAADQDLPPPTQLRGPDPFDPASLRLAANFSASIGVKKHFCRSQSANLTSPGLSAFTLPRSTAFQQRLLN